MALTFGTTALARHADISGCRGRRCLAWFVEDGSLACHHAYMRGVVLPWWAGVPDGCGLGSICGVRREWMSGGWRCRFACRCDLLLVRQICGGLPGLNGCDLLVSLIAQVANSGDGGVLLLDRGGAL